LKFIVARGEYYAAADEAYKKHQNEPNLANLAMIRLITAKYTPALKEAFDDFEKIYSDEDWKMINNVEYMAGKLAHVAWLCRYRDWFDLEDKNFKFHIDNDPDRKVIEQSLIENIMTRYITSAVHRFMALDDNIPKVEYVQYIRREYIETMEKQL